MKCDAGMQILALDRGGVLVFLSVLKRSLDDPTSLQSSIAAMEALCVNDNICKQVCLHTCTSIRLGVFQPELPAVLLY
jgi:hypothetical protein